MKNIIIRMILLSGLFSTAFAADATKLEDINIRDPFVYVDQKNKMYYLYRSKSPAWNIASERGGVEVFWSRDLKEWEGPVSVMSVPADNWATGTGWAPEVHEINGKYYLFATVNDTIQWKKVSPSGKWYVQRGTQIFKGKTPIGPFTSYEEKLPATPMGQMCLDGTFYREGSQNWMVYCHEWVELGDGTVELVKLSKNMKPDSNPLRLFCSSAAPWSTGGELTKGEISYVTDGVYLYKSPFSDNLYMIWSSFNNGNYAIGVAKSKTGKITGPWIHDANPLLNRDGGHGMIFTDLEDKPRLILHGPNYPEGAERAIIYDLIDTGNTLCIKNDLDSDTLPLQ